MQKKLLLISAIPPFPQDSGGATRIFHTLLELSHEYEITFLTFGNDSLLKNRERSFLDDHCFSWSYFELVPRKFTFTTPAFFSCWHSKLLIQKVSDLLSSVKYDSCRIEFSQLLYLVSFFKNQSVTFVIHDISFISAWRQFLFNSNIFNFFSNFFHFVQVYFYEKKFLSYCHQIISVSKDDQKFLRKYFCLDNVVLETNGLAEINFLPKNPINYPIRIGFIGSYLHQPNASAINFILNKIIPIYQKKYGQIIFYLAGNNNFPSQSPHFINLGKLDEVMDFYDKIDILVAPIFAGSGSRIKILESLSYGIPVLTTKIGAEGLNFISPFLQILPKNHKNGLLWAEKISTFHYPNQSSLIELENQLSSLLWKNTLKKL